MYICKNCGNEEYFIEHNCVETEINIDPITGEVSESHDTFLACDEVICKICGTTSNEGDILDKTTRKPIECGC